MHLAAHRVRLHANPDQIVGPKHLQSLLFGQGHPFHPTLMAILAEFGGGEPGVPARLSGRDPPSLHRIPQAVTD